MYRAAESRDVTTVPGQCLQQCLPRWDTIAARRCSADGKKPCSIYDGQQTPPEFRQVIVRWGLTPEARTELQATAAVHLAPEPLARSKLDSQNIMPALDNSSQQTSKQVKSDWLNVYLGTKHVQACMAIAMSIFSQDLRHLTQNSCRANSVLQ